MPTLLGYGTGVMKRHKPSCAVNDLQAMPSVIGSEEIKVNCEFNL